MYSSTFSKNKKEGKQKKSAWRVHIVAYCAGILFLIVTGLFFIFSGIPWVDKDMVLVSFTLAAPEAESVSLVGNFNDWDPESSKMIRINEMWEIKMKLKKGQVYTYNFVINGKEWITDPNSLLNVDDGFGGESSIIKL